MSDVTRQRAPIQRAPIQRVTGEKLPGQGSPVGRRVVLGMLGLGGAGVLFGSKVQRVVARVLQPLTAEDPTGLAALVPGAARFRIYSVVGFLPIRSASAYQLSISGLVEHPMELTFAQLVRMPATRVVKDFQCVTGWRVPGVAWTGVKLSALVDAARPTPQARALQFISFDGTYTESLTLDQAQLDDVIVAYAMQDKPISDAHGGPVRLYVAPMYGYKSCKWLGRIVVTDKVVPGYWEGYGYDVDAWIGHSNGRHDNPVT